MFKSISRILILSIIIVITSYPQNQVKQENKEKTLLSLMGSGIENSKPIEITKPCKIVYYNGAEDMAFSVYLMTMDDNLAQVLVSTAKKGTGETYCYKKGKYYLKIMGMKDWVVNVVIEIGKQKK